MTLDDLTVNFTHLDRESLLSDWNWLIGTTRLPILITAAGDAFVQDTETGAISFLDTVEGTLNDVAENEETFRALLGDRDFVVNRFAVQLIAPLIKAGQGPASGQILSFKQPPVLGGQYDRENLETTDIAVHFSILGQIWSKISQLPPGTPINNVEIREK